MSLGGIAIVLLLAVLCSSLVPEQSHEVFCPLCLTSFTLLVGMQPGKIVINPAVVRNKSANAVTPRKFLVSPVHCMCSIAGGSCQGINLCRRSP